LLESPDLDADDLGAYLEHAGASVYIVADGQAASEAASGLANPVIIIEDAGRVRRSADARPSTFDAVPNAGHLLMTWGKRRRCRVEGLQVVTLDRDALRRQTFLRAVLVAAGRAAPEVAQVSAEDAHSGKQPPSIAEARAQGQLILIAEDDAINQKVILRQVALLGYAAEVANNGTEALRLWREGGFGLLLTDLHMPEMDGYTLVESIRREETGKWRMPIIALTANAVRGEANRARAVGMDDYLTKPVRLRTLQSALERWLPPKNERTDPAALPTALRNAEAAPVLDVSVLKSLVGDDQGTVLQFLSDYVNSARGQVEELRALIAAGNVPRVDAIFHKLKSSSRSVGALALGDLCAELECAGKAGDKLRISQLMPRFEALFAQTAEQIVRSLRESE
jgi:CheY-like chemotaxis protein/HPt (histidine-containing phosphotransfer) domain-containing protein